MPDQESFDWDGTRGGVTFEEGLDRVRLNAQHKRVFEAMRNHHWRTLNEISRLTGDPEASVSARLRDFRKKKFGEWWLGRRRRGEGRRGLFEYQLLPYKEYLDGQEITG